MATNACENPSQKKLKLPNSSDFFPHPAGVKGSDHIHTCSGLLSLLGLDVLLGSTDARWSLQKVLQQDMGCLLSSMIEEFNSQTYLKKKPSPTFEQIMFYAC